MSQETLNAAVLLLRSRALESYSIMSQSEQAAPRVVTPEQSPTLRRSMEQEEVKKKRTRTRKKKAESDE